MIAISIRQPWAHLILTRGKDVENRSWPCPAKYLGRTVLIHASSKPVSETLAYSSLNLPLGGIVGVMTITTCVRDSPSAWAEPAMFHWILANAKEVPFFPCPGRLGFFDVDYPEVLNGTARS